MPELIAKSALAGQKPLTFGAVTLSERTPGPITSIALYRGEEKAVERLLKPLGLRFPAPNTMVVRDPGRMVWTGKDQAFLIGVYAPEGLLPHAALSDQSDGWATLVVSGQGAADVLMRAVPTDLRLSAFPVGRAIRTLLNHMNIVLLRADDYSFEIMVFRSMARSAWHEIQAAMQAMEARIALTQ